MTEQKQVLQSPKGECTQISSHTCHAQISWGEGEGPGKVSLWPCLFQEGCYEGSGQATDQTGTGITDLCFGLHGMHWHALPSDDLASLNQRTSLHCDVILFSFSSIVLEISEKEGKLPKENTLLFV